MSTSNLPEARQRILFCHRKRRNHLNLAELGLTDAHLEHMPEFEKLTQLEFLDLTGNELTRLPGELHGFNRLRWLGLNFNKLEHVEGIQRLQSLERLYLRGNLLTQLPEQFGNLKRLVELDLNGNQLVNLPLSFDDLFADRAEDALYLNLEENPGELTRAHKHGLKAFRAELQALRKASVLVREGKLLFVGEGEAGKSTLLTALRGLPFRHQDKRQQTQGVELEALPLPLNTSQPEVTLNCWDFSGQDPVRDTHQIFFTQPAIYLLVWRARVGYDAQKLIDWLWLIKHRTKTRAKVLIVCTAVGAGGRPRLEDEDRLWKLFGGADGLLLEEHIHSVECNEGPTGKGQQGIQELRDLLLRVVKDEQSGFCQQVSEERLTVVRRLAELKKRRHYMEWDEFETFCHADGKGLKREHVRSFAKQQDEIGRLVWADRGVLAHKVILAPDWLGKALAYVFQPRDRGSQPVLHGIAMQKQVDEEWRQPHRFNSEGDPEPPLDEKMFPTFRAFMAEFDLWHPIDSEGKGDERRYLIPKLLPGSRKEWEAAWSGVPHEPARLLRQVRINGWDRKPLNEWLRRAFFSRLMVRMYSQLLGKDSESAEQHWSNGFRLNEPFLGDARVWMEQGRLFFDACGNKPDALWYGFRTAMKRLVEELALPGTAMEIQLSIDIPCTATVRCERDASEQAALSEDYVLRCSQIAQIPCTQEGCVHMLDVRKLSEGIETDAQRFRHHDQVAHDKLDALAIGLGSLNERAARIDECTTRMEVSLSEFWSRIDAGFQGLRETLSAVLKGTSATEDQIFIVKQLVGEVKSELLDLIQRQDDPHRLGPCLYFIEPAKPEFWTDAGDLFGKKFRLHLCCERTLLPVSWFKSTPKVGSYEFTMDAAWWVATKPILKGVSRLLAVFTPGAGLLGNSADLSGLLAVSDSKILEHGAAILENTEKMLELPPAPGSPQAQGKKKKAPHGLPKLTKASSLGLKQLHSLLFSQTKVPLEIANLGLVRRYDKGQRRHLWVHESQQQNYEDAREVPDRKV